MNGAEIKHLKAAVALAEERNFSRAAARLRMGQSGLTKLIKALERELGYDLFTRASRSVGLTPAGEIFVAEARLTLQHLERAVHLSRAAVEQAVSTLHVGKSPYTDPYLITKLLSLRPPLYPDIQVHLTTKLSPEVTQDLLSGSLDIAFLADMPESASLSGRLVLDLPFYVAMLESNALAKQRTVTADDLRQHSCILFERHVQPRLYDEVMKRLRPASLPGCSLHHVMTAEDALQLILRGFGVAVLTQAGAWRIQRVGVTMRPLDGEDLRVRTSMVARSDNQSRIVSDVVRSFVTAVGPDRNAAQFKLPLRK